MVSVIGFIVAGYFFYQLKVKKKEEKTLLENVDALKIDISNQKIEIESLANNIESLKNERKQLLDKIDISKNNSEILEEKIKDKKLEDQTLKANLKDLCLKINEERENLNTKKKELLHLIDLEKKEDSLKESVQVLAKEVDEICLEKERGLKELLAVKTDISIYKETFDFQELGYFEEPDYLYETSDRFKEEIKIIREEQKDMIKEGDAIYIPNEIALINSEKHTQKVLKNQSALMLKAFNVECDNLMGMVKPSNYAIILERIEKAANNIEKLSVSLECGFEKEYIKLKFKECELQYQFKLKDQREKEEQALIKEQMREEQQAIREFERAMAKAEREEKMYLEALEAARKELEISTDEEKEKLNKKVMMLEERLKEAEVNKERAMSMAEQTKRGHVYIISNIGSFGEDIYKIGLTRRLEPLDRVKELSNVSVPFEFDVHAMIFSENAPRLEKELHKAFEKHRVNKVNSRKEFFKVDLLKIKEEAIELIDDEVDFKLTALAEDYYESLKFKSA